MLFKGASISRGIARGPAHVISPLTLHGAPIAEGDIGRELSRFRAVCEEAEHQLVTLNKTVRVSIGHSSAEIFAVHGLILHDPGFLQKITLAIEQRHVNLEAALDETVGQVSQAFAKLQDPFFRERAADIRDVARRLLAILAIKRGGAPVLAIPEGAIVVLHEMLPSLVADIPSSKVRALVSETGGRMGHAAILARTLGIPAVSGIRHAVSRIKTGDRLIVDGLAGLVHVNPDASVVKEYDGLERDFQAYREVLKGLGDLPARTRDGIGIRLLSNIGNPADADAALRSKAEGVGLFRTEFSFLMRDRFPTEDEQYEVLEAVAKKLHPRPIAIRLLDIGGDKSLAYFPLPNQPNPALGERGIRLMLKHRRILECQLRAILRVSADHPVSIIVPMVVDLAELRHVRQILASVKAGLEAEKRRFDPAIRVGAMIETPAAALTLETLTQESDFFSLGTNDLAQYILVADRTDPVMERYGQPAHPALLAQIRSITKTLAAAGKELTICGDIAGDPVFTELLLGLGLRSFSVATPDLLEIKARIRSISIPQAEEWTRRVLSLRTAEEIRDHLRRRWQPKRISAAAPSSR